MTEDAPRPRRRGRLVALLPDLAVGLAVLAVHAAFLVTAPPLPRFAKYPAAAADLLAGELPTERLVDFSPLYLELHVAARRLLPAQETAVVWLQMAAVAAAVAVLFALLRRRFPTGLAATLAAVLALDRHLLVYARILEPEAVLLLAVTVLVAALTGRATLPRAAIAGVAGATAMATRPSVAPLLAVGLLAILAVRPPRRRRALAAAAFLVPLAVVGALLAVRAERATGSARTPFMSPGTVFFEGNNPTSRGTSAVYPPLVLRLVRYAGGDAPDAGHVAYREVARASAGPDLAVREVNAFWGGRAARFLADHPGHAAPLASQKLVHALHLYRWHDVPTAQAVEASLPLPSVPFSLLAAAALAGVLVSARRWRGSLLFLALAASQVAVMTVFYVSARQRLLLLPALAWFAAAAVERLRRDRRRRWPLAALVAVLAVALSLPTPAVTDDLRRAAGEDRAAALAAAIGPLADTTPPPEKRRLLVARAAETPWWDEPPPFYPGGDEAFAADVAARLATDGAPAFWRALALLRAGRRDEAEALFTAVADAGEDVYGRGVVSGEPRLYLARLAALRGDRDAALALLDAALARAPGDPWVLAERVALADDAEAQRRLLRYWSPLDAQYLVGRALLVHGRAEPAAGALGYVARRLPTLREAKVLLAAALAAAGRDAEAIAVYAAASRQGIEPVWASREIVALASRWAAAHPGDAVVRRFTDRVLRQNGARP